MADGEEQVVDALEVEDLEAAFGGDELEEEKPEPKPDVRTATLDVEDEELKGKTVGEALEQIRALRKALSISEEARRSASDRPAASAAPVAPPPEEKDLTDEEIVELMKDDPVKALQIMRVQNNRMIARHLDNRLSSLAEGSISTARAEAMRMYPDEFKILGDEITKWSGNFSKEILSNVEGWTNLVSYVRGRPENITKLRDHWLSSEARASQRATAGASLKSASADTRPEGSGGGDYGLDATEKEIADALGVSYKKYAQGKKLNR